MNVLVVQTKPHKVKVWQADSQITREMERERWREMERERERERLVNLNSAPAPPPRLVNKTKEEPRQPRYLTCCLAWWWLDGEVGGLV